MYVSTSDEIPGRPGNVTIRYFVRISVRYPSLKGLSNLPLQHWRAVSARICLYALCFLRFVSYLFRSKDGWPAIEGSGVI